MRDAAGSSAVPCGAVRVSIWKSKCELLIIFNRNASKRSPQRGGQAALC